MGRLPLASGLHYGEVPQRRRADNSLTPLGEDFHSVYSYLIEDSCCVHLLLRQPILCDGLGLLS